MTQKYGGASFKRETTQKALDEFKTSEYSSTTGGYIMECKVKRFFHNLRLNETEIVKLELKIEKLTIKDLRKAFDMLSYGKVYDAVEMMGMQHRVCTCEFKEYQHDCGNLKSTCKCCLNCQKDCKKMFRAKT